VFSGCPVLVLFSVSALLRKTRCAPSTYAYIFADFGCKKSLLINFNTTFFWSGVSSLQILPIDKYRLSSALNKHSMMSLLWHVRRSWKVMQLIKPNSDPIYHEPTEHQQIIAALVNNYCHILLCGCSFMATYSVMIVVTIDWKCSG